MRRALFTLQLRDEGLWKRRLSFLALSHFPRGVSPFPRRAAPPRVLMIAAAVTVCSINARMRARGAMDIGRASLDWRNAAVGDCMRHVCTFRARSVCFFLFLHGEFSWEIAKGIRSQRVYACQLSMQCYLAFASKLLSCQIFFRFMADYCALRGCEGQICIKNAPRYVLTYVRLICRFRCSTFVHNEENYCILHE